MNDIQKRASLIDLLKSLTAEAESRADKNATQAEVYQTELDPFFDKAAHALREAADRLSTPPPTIEGFSPCPTCHQYSHSIGDDKLADAFNHFQSMFSHRGDGIPTQFNFGEQTRDAAQVLMAAADRGGIRREARQCSVCTAVVAEYPEGMCCHCHEMPWPVQALKETPDGNS